MGRFHCGWNGIVVVLFISICVKVNGFHNEQSILVPSRDRRYSSSRFCSQHSKKQYFVLPRIISLNHPDSRRPSNLLSSTGRLSLFSWRQDPNLTRFDRKTDVKRWYQNVSLQIYQWWNQVQKLIRTYWERHTIYVLECRDGKYYVGMTANRQRRFRQHSTGDGSAWTQKYPPIQIWKEYRRIPPRYALGLEAQVTAELMWEFGVNNVRGAMFAQTRAFHQGDMGTLVQFLGHYNGLSYRKVRQVLQATLPPIPSEPIIDEQRLQRMTSIAQSSQISVGPTQRKCYQCGKYGHLAANCPTASLGTSRKKCYRCGRYGHIAADCSEIIAKGSKGNTKPDTEIPVLCDYCAQMGHTSDGCPLL